MQVKVIYEDTRQQRGKHDLKNEYFKSAGYTVMHKALECGDYQLKGKPQIAIDTKKDIDEVIGDIHTGSITIAEAKETISGILLDGQYDLSMLDDLKHIICDKDIDRYPEYELADYGYKHNIRSIDLNKLQNVYVKRKGFFHRGLKRAKFNEVKLYVMVENTYGIKKKDDLINPANTILKNRGKWKNTIYTFEEKQTLYKSLCTMEERYGVQFLFCRPEIAGKYIVKVLEQ